MFWIGAACILLIIVLIAVLSSQIYGDFYFSRVKDNDQLFVEIRALFGIVRFRYVIPVIQFKGLHKGVLVKTEAVNQTQASLEGQAKEHITKEKVLEFFKNAKVILEHTAQLYDWMKKTIAKAQVTHLSWITRVGVGDAPETAITTGAIWAIKSSLLGFGIRFIQMLSKPKVAVTPQYNATYFSTEFVCKGRIRTWHVMWAGIALVIRISKVKGGLRVWYEMLRKPRMKPAS
ncbi:DUF2953 domain-containing protein [Paenibacillus hexagrammi]|uniref:DUF2953 domain-containing protein n=1 Tax=Paenibacillus hexagrammi TaxID=2908839 RepID=A0ABY3SE43_9BACL|nr:DUF2953 domain-containing protein [Paenibacillus sp. YPD9-1]UJF31182.1 DUF2953 domain-containing protein [Paenibacillus sp. YPD9-1]